MDVDQGQHSPEDEDEGGAEQAFEALRAEVAALRHGIEMVYRLLQQAGQQPAAAVSLPGPDYSLTLGQMERLLQAIAGRLEGVERHPALRLTPAGMRAEVERLTWSASEAATRPLIEALLEAQTVTKALTGLAGQVQTHQEQRAGLWTAGGVGLMAGAALWILLAALLPWGAGHWMAALPLGGKWVAGQVLLQEADPATWDRMRRLNNACPADSMTELCEAAIALRTIAPLQDETKAPAPVPPLPVPQVRPAPRSRTGQPVQ